VQRCSATSLRTHEWTHVPRPTKGGLAYLPPHGNHRFGCAANSKMEFLDLHRRVISSVPGTSHFSRGSLNSSAEDGHAILGRVSSEVETYWWAGEYRFPDAASALSYYENTVYFTKASSDKMVLSKMVDAAERFLSAAIQEQRQFVVGNCGTIHIVRGPAPELRCYCAIQSPTCADRVSGDDESAHISVSIRCCRGQNGGMFGCG
jgi:hypothetical protein